MIFLFSLSTSFFMFLTIFQRFREIYLWLWTKSWWNYGNYPKYHIPLIIGIFSLSIYEIELPEFILPQN